MARAVLWACLLGASGLPLPSARAADGPAAELAQSPAQDFGPLTPKSLPSVIPPPPPGNGPVPAAEGDPTVIAGTLMGVVVAHAPDQVQASGAGELAPKKEDGSVRFLPGIPEGDRAGLRDALASYVGQPVSMLSINEMLRDIVRFYQARDHPMVDAYLPEQDMADGILQIVVVESRRNAVRAEGNKWFSSSLIESNIRTPQGAPIVASRMNGDVAWLNRNPFLQGDLVYAPGADPVTTDIVLKTRDRFPLRTYAGYEDSGNSLTGYDRYIEGFNWGNVLGIGDQFNYQFMSDSRFDLLKAHSASYVHDFRWHHSLTIFGSYADTKAIFPPGIPLQSSGSSWQTSARYTIPLGDIRIREVGTFNHEIVLGYDFKESDSQLLYNQVSLSGPTPTADVSQFSIGYDFSLPDPGGATSFTGALFYSPGGMTQDNRKDNFVQSNASSASYTYVKLTFNRVTRLPWNYTLLTKASYQWAGARLIGSEQMGLGGYDTVRGYDDREANGDSGYFVSGEIRTPGLSLGHFIDRDYTTDQLQFLAFTDYGGVSQYRPDDLSLAGTPSTNPDVNLWSIGTGLRYTLAPYLTVRFDYGWQLIDSGLSSLFRSGNNSRGELGITLSY